MVSSANQSQIDLLKANIGPRVQPLERQSLVAGLYLCYRRPLSVVSSKSLIPEPLVKLSLMFDVHQIQLGIHQVILVDSVEMIQHSSNTGHQDIGGHQLDQHQVLSLQTGLHDIVDLDDQCPLDQCLN